MPKMLCKCGESIDLSRIPNPADFKILWEPHIEGLVEKLIEVHKGAKSVDDFERDALRLIDPLVRPNPHVLECSACGRIGVLTHPSDSSVAIWYTLESHDDLRKSLRSLFE